MSEWYSGSNYLKGTSIYNDSKPSKSSKSDKNDTITEQQLYDRIYEMLKSGERTVKMIQTDIACGRVARPFIEGYKDAITRYLRD